MTKDSQPEACALVESLGPHLYSKQTTLLKYLWASQWVTDHPIELSDVEKGGGCVMFFWHDISKCGNHPVHYGVSGVRIELCVNLHQWDASPPYFLYFLGGPAPNKWACCRQRRLRGLTALQEHRALRASLWIVWLMLLLWLGYVMSGICDRSSMRWWWRLHKPAVPRETHKYCTCTHTH